MGTVLEIGGPGLDYLHMLLLFFFLEQNIYFFNQTFMNNLVILSLHVRYAYFRTVSFQVRRFHLLQNACLEKQQKNDFNFMFYFIFHAYIK